MNKLILSLILLAVVAFGQPKKVFVPYFRAAANTKIDRATCGSLSDLFASSLKDQTGWDVFTEGDISSMLEQEDRKKLVDCTEGSCMQEIAGAIGAPCIISGNIAVLEGTYILNLTLINIKDGAAAGKASATGTSVSLIMKKFDAMAAKVAGVTVRTETGMAVKSASASSEVPQSSWVQKEPSCYYGMKLRPAGTFEMGSTSKSDEQPVHLVTLSSFYVDSTEVSQQEYSRLMGKNPSHYKGGSLTVEQVSWFDAIKYCNARSRESGLGIVYDENTGEVNWAAKGYRLPTEAEWEYVRSTGKYNDELLDTLAWYWGNSINTTHPVGAKKPNRYSVYDIAGNVHEWCNDWFGTYSNQKTSDPHGPEKGMLRVNRGGSSYSGAGGLESTRRNKNKPVLGDYDIGFRCVLSF